MGTGESRREEGVKEKIGRLVEDEWGGWEGVHVCALCEWGEWEGEGEGGKVGGG